MWAPWWSKLGMSVSSHDAKASNDGMLIDLARDQKRLAAYSAGCEEGVQFLGAGWILYRLRSVPAATPYDAHRPCRNSESDPDAPLRVRFWGSRGSLPAQLREPLIRGK